jgi:hypothetical protein
LYGYAGDDPIDFNDPFGLDKKAPSKTTTFTQLKNAAKSFVCKSSPENRILSSMRFGAFLGAVRVGALGFVGGEIFEPVGGGVPGAAVGASVGSIFGAASGVFTGSELAFGCSLIGAYGG